MEHAGSPRVAKHTGPSEKRKHRRAAEDNRRPPPSPGTAEIVLSPSAPSSADGYFRPPRCSLSLPLRRSPVFGGFPGNRGKASPACRFRKSRLCDLDEPDRQKRLANRAIEHGLFLARTTQKYLKGLGFFFIFRIKRNERLTCET